MREEVSLVLTALLILVLTVAVKAAENLKAGSWEIPSSSPASSSMLRKTP